MEAPASPQRLLNQIASGMNKEVRIRRYRVMSISHHPAVGGQGLIPKGCQPRQAACASHVLFVGGLTDATDRSAEAHDGAPAQWPRAARRRHGDRLQAPPPGPAPLPRARLPPQGSCGTGRGRAGRRGALAHAQEAAVGAAAARVLRRRWQEAAGAAELPRPLVAGGRGGESCPMRSVEAPGEPRAEHPAAPAPAPARGAALPLPLPRGWRGAAAPPPAGEAAPAP